MDSRRFDLLARRLSTRISRRGTLALFLGGAAATVAGGAARAADPARTTCRAANAICRTNAQCCSGFCDTRVVAHRTRRNRCGCPAPLTPCGSQCVDTQTSERNCGACGRRCPAGQICRNGACAIPSCHDSDARNCLETIDGRILELSHDCVEGTDWGCLSSLTCEQLLATAIADGEFEDSLSQEMLDDVAADCISRWWHAGAPQLEIPAPGECIFYARNRADEICPD